MSLITILVGISGSGKTTITKALLESKASPAVRINRDDTRLMLFGVSQSDEKYYARKDLRECELLVSETLEDVIYNALDKGRDIILDNTNLQKKYIDEVIFKYNHLADIEILIQHVDVKIAKERVSKRNNSDGSFNTDYIDKQFNDLTKLVKSLHGERLFYPQVNTTVKFDESKPPTYVYDLDGTLAMKGERDIFDDSKLHLDTEIKEVGNILRALSQEGFKTVFVSGRQDSCKETTVQWLKDNRLWLRDSEIYMRKAKDQRNDTIVKEEIVLNELIPRYNVIGVIDDRIGVTRNFHKLGIFVLNVNQGFRKF